MEEINNDEQMVRVLGITLLFTLHHVISDDTFVLKTHQFKSNLIPKIKVPFTLVRYESSITLAL